MSSIERLTVGDVAEVARLLEMSPTSLLNVILRSGKDGTRVNPERLA